MAEYEQLAIRSRAELRRWLSAHHDDSPGIWLVREKKGAGRAHVPYDDVVEEALCVGWVDSLPRSLDDARSMLLLTPRKPKSGWSRANKKRIARLQDAGLMTPAGVAAVETAKANGAWTALDEVEELREPDDLRAALDANPDARRNWDAFPRSAKRGILEWIAGAKKTETRRRRVEQTAEEAANGRRANQWRQPGGTR